MELKMEAATYVMPPQTVPEGDVFVMGRGLASMLQRVFIPARRVRYPAAGAGVTSSPAPRRYITS